MTRTSFSRFGRRTFYKQGVLTLAAATWSSNRLNAREEKPELRFGVVTDLHYADKPPAGTRHYRQSIAKLADAAQQYRESRPDFLVELGDLIDAADSVELELGYLDSIDRKFAPICEDRHYVLGNHCVDTLTKAQFLQRVGQPRSYYSFDRGSFHFVVLDSCFRSDGQPYERRNFDWKDANIPEAELAWLKADLAKTDRYVIVFAHQRLDVGDRHSIRNHAETRNVLESHGSVLAVFQGHSHANDLQKINGIHYCTLVAMVEGSGAGSNGFAIVELHANGTLHIHGFRQQASYRWPV